MKLNSAKTAEDLQTAKGKFAAQIDVSPGWHSNYYAALSALKEGEMLLRANKLSGIETLANEAAAFLDPIMKTESKNSEVRLLMAYVHLLKMNANSSAIESERKKAREILYLSQNNDPNNPRFDLLRTELEYWYLKGKGNDKDLKNLFQNAAKKLRAFSPKAKTDPNWGLKDAEYYISVLK
ncbi:MAG: hypothetical protein K0M56_09115 [Kaistella sp.]|nr:hypothetical protein [Kaistella sp.]